MATRPLSHPPPPFTAPMSGTIEERLSAIAAALNRKADAGIQNAAYHFIALISPDGTTWRISITNAGVLVFEQVPRV